MRVEPNDIPERIRARGGGVEGGGNRAESSVSAVRGFGGGARDDVPGGLDDSTRGGWRRVGRAPKDEREEAAAGGAASARRRSRFLCSRFLRGIGPVQTGPAVSSVTARRQHHGLARYLARADAARERAANEIGDASGDPRVIVRASRVVASLAILGPCARSGVSSHDPGWPGGSARARPPAARDARPPRPRILRARKDALPRWAARAWRGRGVPPEGARDLSDRFRRPRTRSSEVSTSIIFWSARPSLADTWLGGAGLQVLFR